jgi:hypothetical protein
MPVRMCIIEKQMSQTLPNPWLKSVWTGFMAHLILFTVNILTPSFVYVWLTIVGIFNNTPVPPFMTQQSQYRT